MAANVFLGPSYISHRQQMCRTGSFPLLPPDVSHVVAKHDVLLGQFEQHRVVEELVDTDVFTEALEAKTHTVKYKHQVAPYRDQQPITTFSLAKCVIHKTGGAVHGQLKRKTCINGRCCQNIRTNIQLPLSNTPKSQLYKNASLIVTAKTLYVGTHV